jgi:hypothetical protein
MAETRKLTTIVVADVGGYSRVAASDEERAVARLRALRGDLIDPVITAHHGPKQHVCFWLGRHKSGRSLPSRRVGNVCDH